MRRSGNEIILHYLKEWGIPYIVGIPGHGSINIIDPIVDNPKGIQVLQVRHEQSAAHIADGYWRVAGTPLAVFTSIGPGAINTAVGVASAYVDSIPLMLFTGGTHTYMQGAGILQEIERKCSADFPSVLKPITKRIWHVERVNRLPKILRDAYNKMMSGRKGPVLIDVPMDVQADSAEIQMYDGKPRVLGKFRGDFSSIQEAAELFTSAKRPVILAGGGAVSAGAAPLVLELAEYLGAPVLSTLMSKGVIPEDHVLSAGLTGAIGTSCGNKIANQADVLLAVGCRFEDQTASSYVPGKAFSIPPTKLIQIDIAPQEIGKNFPVEIGIVGDAVSVLEELYELIRKRVKAVDYGKTAYFQQLQKLKQDWFQELSRIRDADVSPVPIPRFYKELREVLDRDAYVLTDAGHPQVHLIQSFPFYVPGTNLTSGGFSCMGYAFPAGIGAKLAAPDKQVVAVCGDGSFMMTMQELATAVQYNIPVVVVVLNNFGWQSILDLQINTLGKERVNATEFRKSSGELHNPHFADVAKAFGAFGIRVSEPGEIRPALESAFASEGPALVEVMVSLDAEYSNPISTGGWWDMPVPSYLETRRKQYEEIRDEERM